MRGFNIITDESELTFMVMAANRPLLKWMWAFIKNALAPKISVVSSICVDSFIVQAHNRADFTLWDYGTEEPFEGFTKNKYVKKALKYMEDNKL